MRILNVILVVVMFLLVAGCASVPMVSPDHELIGETRISAVKSFIDVSLETKNLSVEIIDFKTLVVSGKILNPTLIFNIARKEEQFRAIGAWVSKNAWFPTSRTFPNYRKRERWPLSSIKFWWTVGEWLASSTINSDGSFRAIIKADASSSFIKPKWNKYYDVFVEKRNLAFFASHTMHGSYVSQVLNISLGIVNVYTVKENTGDID